jgi:hypothetical protein
MTGRAPHPPPGVPACVLPAWEVAGLASVPCGPGWHAEGRVEAVEEVGYRDHQHQSRELPLIVVPGGLGPDLIGDRAGPVRQPGLSLSERQRGALGVVEERVLIPSGDGEQLLGADAGLRGALDAGVDAGAAAVDLARAGELAPVSAAARPRRTRP